MSVRLSNNYIFVKPGQKAFLAASNYVNYLELGRKGLNDHYLKAEIKDDEFVVSGKLYDEKGTALCTIRENNLEDMASKCKLNWLRNGGYEVIHEERGQLLKIATMPEQSNICILQGKFYDSKGNLIAEGNDQDFVIYKGPAVLGKSGSALGIVLR